MSTPIVLEIDKVRTTAGTEVVLDAIVPSVDSTSAEVIAWRSGTWVNDGSFAQTSYVNTQVSNLVGGASTSADTLGKIESIVSTNSSDIALIQSTVANKSTIPSTDSLADEVLRYVGGTLVNDNTFASKNYVIAEIATAKNDIIGGAGAAYDTLLEIQNELQSNDTDISNILTTMATKATIPSVDTASTEVLAWRSGSWVNDPTFAQTSYVNAEITNLIGGGTTNYNTLGKIENVILALDSAYQAADSNLQTQINDNDTDIAALQGDVSTNSSDITTLQGNVTTNTADIAQEETDRIAADNAIIGGASVTHDTLGKIEAVINTLDSAYQTADLNLQNQITSNDSDITDVQTDTANNTAAINQEVSDRQTADNNIIGGATANFDTLGKIEGEVGTLNAYVNTEITDLKNEIIGGASGAYDTLLEIENHITTNATDIGTILTTMSTKAPKPPTGISAGEFLRWDEVNEEFTFATPATGSSGTTIPTPSTTTDTSTSGSTEVLIWDNTAGDLKNIASPFVEKPAVSSAGEYLSWNGTSLVNSIPAGGGVTPPTQTSVNTFLYHDGTNWQYGTPSVGSGSGTTVTSGVVQAVNNTVSGGEALSGSGYSSKGYASITTQLVNSMVLFMTSGTPQVNGEAHMYVHWRYRDTSSSPWSAYQDTGKILMRIAESYTLSEPREGAIAIHAPMRPAGAEIEYRVYFHVVVGTIYYPDNSVVSQLTNMTLMEVAI